MSISQDLFVNVGDKVPCDQLFNSSILKPKEAIKRGIQVSKQRLWIRITSLTVNLLNVDNINKLSQVMQRHPDTNKFVPRCQRTSYNLRVFCCVYLFLSLPKKFLILLTFSKFFETSIQLIHENVEKGKMLNISEISYNYFDLVSTTYLGNER